MELESFRRLLTAEGQRALAAATEVAAADPVKAVTVLRRTFDAELTAVALTQVRLRVRAREKFGIDLYGPHDLYGGRGYDADRMYFTSDGLEQATRQEVAAHRAGRFVGAGPGHNTARAGPGHNTARLTRDTGPIKVADLCCGIGGDLIALSRAGCEVEAVDADPLTAEVARANLAALGLPGTVKTADASSVETTGHDAVFIDPARRRNGRRVFDPEAYSPPWSAVAELLKGTACVKAAPGIPHEIIPADTEAEWVSFRGEVKEAALWSGAFATEARRRATLLPVGVSLTGEGAEATTGPPGGYLYEPDGAVVRAHLVAEAAERIGGRLLDPNIAYITSDTLVDTPWAQPYKIDEVLPFSLKRLRAALRERRIGAVTIMKRGSAVDVERLRRELRLEGDKSAVVALTRIGARPYALICKE